MTRNTRSNPKRPAKAPASLALRAVPWAAMGVVVISLALMASVGPSNLLGLLNRSIGQAKGSLSLTVLHSNDTYGYVFPCG